jgi:hypothetical protein
MSPSWRVRYCLQLRFPHSCNHCGNKPGDSRHSGCFQEIYGHTPVTKIKAKCAS